ncbi:biotin transporter BioY [Adlercreutzia murintestinalis]|uniref:biotin transporter BioY n=1 Tax=Adlercreutzia murintestinalis TaxID=2941325 RepID=UPI002040326E|nr:biotin transporter BioY [Adlercreutzia murintestinalis]
MQQEKSTSSLARSRARSCALVGLSTALIAVCSWFTIPIGPVPFTLQMFAIPFIICVLRPGEAIAAVAAYLALGAVGVPVFSGMRGGIGVLMGPTGGFLIGYLLGVILAVLVLHVLHTYADTDDPNGTRFPDPAERARMTAWQRFRANLMPCGLEVVAGLIFSAVAYIVGWAQYMMVTGTSPEVAFMAAAAPFIVPDVVKVVAAVLCAQPVKMFSKRR